MHCKIGCKDGMIIHFKAHKFNTRSIKVSLKSNRYGFSINQTNLEFCMSILITQLQIEFDVIKINHSRLTELFLSDLLWAFRPK